MDRGAWRATVHGVTKSRTQLSDSHGRLSRASGPGRAVLHCSVTRRDGGLAQPCHRGALPCGGTSITPWPTPLCSAPGLSAAPSHDHSQGFSTVPPQGAALHTIV